LVAQKSGQMVMNETIHDQRLSRYQKSEALGGQGLRRGDVMSRACHLRRPLSIPAARLPEQGLPLAALEGWWTFALSGSAAIRREIRIAAQGDS